jgi:hypothetical protein
VGFLAYKFALTTVLYETVRSMMLSDSKSFYDTTPKEYNNLDDWNEQYGEIKIEVDEVHEPQPVHDEEND